MNEARRHVLLWVAPEFLKSSGMIQLFSEAGIFSLPENEMENYIRAAVGAGGFALTGKLADVHHGSGVWISPVNVPGLELMVPWHYVKSIVTAGTPQASRIFGLATNLSQVKPAGGTQPK